MRTGKVVVLSLLLVAGSMGCAAQTDDGDGVATAQDGGATASASASPSATFDEDAPLKFAQCMRKNGMTWFPDPQPNGRTTIKTPKGMDPKKFDAAQEACKQFAPNGGQGFKPNPEMIESARKMAKCMRENGVPNFPDPTDGGMIQIDPKKLGTGPGQPTFDKAEEKCSEFRPDGAKQNSAGGDDGGPEFGVSS